MVQDFTLGIPQDDRNPLLDWFDQADEIAAKHRRDMARWRMQSIDTVDRALLDPDAFYAGRDFSADPDPATARQALTLRSYLTVANDGRPVTGDLLPGYLRDRIAREKFAGRGEGSDEAFLAEIRKEAETRRDARALSATLSATAATQALVESSDVAATGFPMWLAEARNQPGYQPGHDFAYLELWNDEQARTREAAEEFGEALPAAWRTLAGRGQPGDQSTAFEHWQSMDGPARARFLDTLGRLGRSLSPEQRRGFWSNFAVQGSRDISRLAGAAGRAAWNAPDTFRENSLSGSFDTPEEAEARLLETQADRRWQTDWRSLQAGISRVLAEDYDPVRGNWGDDESTLRAVEAGLYSIPGVVATVAPALLPGGQAFSVAMLEDEAWNNIHSTLLEAGLDPADAAERATGLSGSVAAVNYLPERFGLNVIARRIPSIAAATDKIQSALGRGILHAASAQTAEFSTETFQNYSHAAILDALSLADSEIPGGNLSRETESFWTDSVSTFTAVLPLALMGVPGAMSREAHARAVAATDTRARAAWGYTEADNAAIDAAEGPAALADAVERAESNRDPKSETAKDATQELAEEIQAAREAEAEAARQATDNGIIPRAVLAPDGTWTLYDTATGDEIGKAPNWQGAARLATAHANYTADRDADRIATVFSAYQAAEASGEWSRQTGRTTETQLDLGREMTAADFAGESRAARERAAAQERLMGGDGSLTSQVFGRSQTEFAEGQLRTVNLILGGGSVLDVFHEEAHGFRRAARAAGTLTRDDDLAILRAVDTVLAGTTREGTRLAILPENFDALSEADQDIALDEGISQLMESEVIRSRKGGGQRPIPAGIVSKNLAALSRLLGDQRLGKFRAFITAVREFFGLAIDRAAAIQRGLAEGTLDRQSYDSYLAKLYGIDEQLAYEQMVRDAEAEILEGAEMVPSVDGDPFSLGRAAAMTTVAENAMRKMADVRPDIGGYSREIGMEGPGNGWDAARGMSGNAARAIDNGKLMEPDFRAWAGEFIGFAAISKNALQAGNATVGNLYREYHHVGRRREIVDFYDPEVFEKSPKFWLGLAKHYETSEPAPKKAKAARKAALTAWQNLRQDLIDGQLMGDWKGSETAPVRNQSGLPADIVRHLKAGKNMEEARQAVNAERALAAEAEEGKNLGKLLTQRNRLAGKLETFRGLVSRGEFKPNGNIPDADAYLAKREAEIAALDAEIEKATPARAAEAADMPEGRETGSGLESRQSLAPNFSKKPEGASEFSLGSARQAVLAKYDSLQREIPAEGQVSAIKLRTGHLLTFPQNHVLYMERHNILPEDVQSGGWVVDGQYEASERSDTMRWVRAHLAKRQASFSLGSARLGVLTSDSIRRIKDPLRRAQAMERISRKLEELRLDAERLELLAGGRRIKRSLAREARIRQAIRRDELENEAWARHMAVLSDDDLTKLRAQPGHAFLADPDSHLKGRLLSRTAAAKKHPDLFTGTSSPAEYDGSENVSRTLFGGTLAPDQAAQEMFEAGLIREPSTDAMWQLLESESKHVASMKRVLEAAKADLREARTVAKAETNAWLAEQTAGQKDLEVTVTRQSILERLAALDAILSSVPPEIRGKVGGYVQAARITGPDAGLEFLRERLAKVDKAMEEWLRRQYDIELFALLDRARPEKDEAGKRPRGKIGADVHQLFADLRDAVTLTAAETEAEALRLETLAAQEDLTPEQQSHATLQANLVRLVGDWSKATAARREAAVLEATRVFEAGYMAHKIQLLRQREDRNKKRGILALATGRKGTREERRAREQKDTGTRTGRVLKAGLSLLSFEQLVHKTFGEGTAEADSLIDWERRAAHAKADALQNKLDQLDDLFASLAGGKFKGEQLRHKLSDPASIRAVDSRGTSHTFSQLEAITATLMWRQEDGRRHMEGHLDDQGKPVGKWHFDQAFIDELEDALSDNAKAVRLHLAEQYAAEYDRLNSVFRQLYGISMPRHAHYSPLTVAPAQAAGGQTLDPVTGSDMTGAGLTPGSLKTRSTSAVAEPQFRDALQTYIAHAKQMEHWLAYAPFATEAMALVNSRDVGNSVEAAAGKEALATLRGWLDYFAQGGTRDAAAHLAGNQLLNRMMGRAAAVALVGRVSVLAIQSTQLGAALAEMPARAYIVRLAKLFAGRLDWSAALRSDYIQRRKNQMPPVVQQAMEGLASSKPNRLKYAVRKMGETIAGADALFTAGTFAIAYDYHLSEAKRLGVADPHAYARQAAERSTDRVAQPVRAGTRSLFEVTGTNPSVRLAWSFASEARQKLALSAYALGSKKQAGAKTRALAVTWLAGGLMASVIRATMRDLRDDDDDEIFDEKNWDPTRLALSSLTGPFAGIPFIGDTIESAVFKAAGEYLPEGNMFSTGERAAASAARMIQGEGPEDLEDAIRTAETILSGAGLFSESAAASASLSHLLRDLVAFVENAIAD